MAAPQAQQNKVLPTPERSASAPLPRSNLLLPGPNLLLGIKVLSEQPGTSLRFSILSCAPAVHSSAIDRSVPDGSADLVDPSLFFFSSLPLIPTSCRCPRHCLTIPTQVLFFWLSVFFVFIFSDFALAPSLGLSFSYPTPRVLFINLCRRLLFVSAGTGVGYLQQPGHTFDNSLTINSEPDSAGRITSRREEHLLVRLHLDSDQVAEACKSK